MQYITTNDMIKLLVIDLFCGFGGVTYAMENCKEVRVIAAVNHDPDVIKK